MNGHAQSGGHWNAAFGLGTTGLGGSGPPQWSSRSGDGSAKGILFMIGGTRGRGAAVPWLRHQIGTGKTHGEGHIGSSTSTTIHSIYNRPLFRVCSRLHNCEITLDTSRLGADGCFTIITKSVRQRRPPHRSRGHYLCYGQDQPRCSRCRLLTYGGSEEKREVFAGLPVSRIVTKDCSLG